MNQRNQERWKPLSRAAIPEIKKEGFDSNVLQRDIWGDPETEKTPKHEMMQQTETALPKTEIALPEKEDDLPKTEIILSETEMIPSAVSEELTAQTETKDLPKTAYFIRQRTNERIEISETPFIIGKSSEADYKIEGNTAISRKHIKITKDAAGGEERYLLEDLNSLNHTYVDEQQIAEPVEIKPGQTIMLADENFDFCME